EVPGRVDRDVVTLQERELDARGADREAVVERQRVDVDGRARLALHVALDGDAHVQDGLAQVGNEIDVLGPVLDHRRPGEARRVAERGRGPAVRLHAGGAARRSAVLEAPKL